MIQIITVEFKSASVRVMIEQINNKCYRAHLSIKTGEFYDGFEYYTEDENSVKLLEECVDHLQKHYDKVVGGSDEVSGIFTTNKVKEILKVDEIRRR